MFGDGRIGLLDVYGGWRGFDGSCGGRLRAAAGHGMEMIEMRGIDEMKMKG